MNSETNYFVMVIEYLEETWRALFSYGTCKMALSFIFTAFGLLVGVENYDILLGLGILILLDFLTGVMSSVRQGQSITSVRAVKTVTKSIVFLIFFAAANQTGLIIPGMYEFITTGIASFLALTEFISVAENVAKMGYSIPQKLLNQIKPEVQTPNCEVFGNDKSPA
jgi:phage-related holin